MCSYDYQAAEVSELAGVIKNILAAASKATQSDSLKAIALLKKAYNELLIVMKEAKNKMDKVLDHRADVVKDNYINLSFKVESCLHGEEDPEARASAKIIAKRLKPLTKIFYGNANTRLGNIMGELENIKKIKLEHFKAVGAERSFKMMLKTMEGYEADKQNQNEGLLEAIGGTPLSIAKRNVWKAVSHLYVKMRSVQANEDAEERDDVFTTLAVNEWQKAAAAQKTARAIRKKKRDESKGSESGK